MESVTTSQPENLRKSELDEIILATRHEDEGLPGITKLSEGIKLLDSLKTPVTSPNSASNEGAALGAKVG